MVWYFQFLKNYVAWLKLTVWKLDFLVCMGEVGGVVAKYGVEYSLDNELCDSFVMLHLDIGWGSGGSKIRVWKVIDCKKKLN